MHRQKHMMSINSQEYISQFTFERILHFENEIQYSENYLKYSVLRSVRFYKKVTQIFVYSI